MKALVWGAGGFIGSHLVRKLKTKGFWVRGVDLKYPEYSTSVADDFIIGDLRDPIIVMDVIKDIEFDEAYQLAADMGGAGYLFTGDNDADIMLNSALINLNMCRYGTGIKKIFYSSSACVYPEYNQTDPDNPNCTEDSVYPASPDSEYGWEKLFSERMYLAFHRNHKMNVRIARFHNIFGECFDNKTEILTEKGFKFFKDITFKDKFATRNPNTGKVEYQSATAIQNFEYKGPMYSIKTSDIDMFITPDHFVFVSTRTTKTKNKIMAKYNTPFQLKKIKNVIHSRIKFRSDFNWDSYYNLKFFELPEITMKDGRRLQSGKGLAKQIPIGIWLEFLGWYLSEGSCFCTPTNYTVAITQSEKKVVNKIIACVNKMGFVCHYTGKSVIISSKQLWNYCKQFGHSHDKYIPREFLSLNKNLLQTLFNFLMLGDGDHNYNNKNSFKYSSVSYQLASDVQELAFKLGFQAWIGTEKIRGYYSPQGKYYDKDSTIFRVNICKNLIHTIKKYQIQSTEYIDTVYDITVPNHIIFIRRNGKCVWSGNCGSWNNGKEKAPAAICRKVAQAENNSEIEIWGDGCQTRSFLYIDECLDAIKLFMDSNFTGPINIGAETLISINDLAKLIMIIANKNLTIKHIPGPIGVKGRRSDNKLIFEKLAWRPSENLVYGLTKTYAWINSQISGGSRI